MTGWHTQKACGKEHGNSRGQTDALATTEKLARERERERERKEGREGEAEGGREVGKTVFTDSLTLFLGRTD